ncbi:MAG TPA: Gfo/Idh/MocA family oxidoreductase [Bryobacteraceae bacterium]|jgi:predicted dehydrogenase
MKQWNAAVIGGGFVGRVHLEAIRRLGHVNIAALADPKLEKAEQLAAEFSIGRAGTDYHDILQDPTIDAVHICTPNHLHFPIVMAALEAGKHVVCEKPLAVSVEEAKALVGAAARTGKRNCVCHNLRYYPAVQHMRGLREAGELGEILVVQGSYLQDWLAEETDWNWRVLSSVGGPSRCMADIGSHWFDMAEHVTGSRVSALCADLQTFHQTRKRPKANTETFAGKLLEPGDYDVAPIDTEDFGAVLFQLGDRARGVMTASQISRGRKNRLSIEIYGSKSSVAWDQERPDELWLGFRNTNNQVLVKDPALLREGARRYADLPGGHSEGYDDTFKQVFRRFYASLENPQCEPEYPQFRDGLRQLQILEASLVSSRRRAWVKVNGAEVNGQC